MATSVDLAHRVSAESVGLAARPAAGALARAGPLPVERRRAATTDSDPAAWPAPLLAYLPLALLATASVVFLPAVIVAAIMPRGGVALAFASIVVAVATSLAIAAAEAALWKRCPRSRDVLFADLMLWGWARRRWAERRLARARALYDSATRAGPTVSIELLTGLTNLLEARDAYTHGHSQRVARYAERIARAMRLDPVQVAKVRTAAAVHDVGKLYTPRSILNNPRRLSEEEFDVMKRHAGDGADMLAAVGDPEIAAMVRHHHERIDGSGYPDGLAGAEIPLGSRIIAVADTFDSITSNRPYRRADTQKRALDILSREAGRQLDGDAVGAFRHRYSARTSVAGWAFAVAALQRALAVIQTGTASLATAVGGLGSLLPAFGAAGLLALSPGLHRHALGATSAPETAGQAGGPLALAPGPAVGVTEGPTARGRSLTGSGHARAGGPPASTGRPLSSASPPAAADVPASGEGPSAGTGSSGGSSSSGGPPSSPSQPSPGGGAHGGGAAPSLPALPVSPPATPTGPAQGGSTPSVSTPSASTPPASTPVIPIPGITVPSETVPSEPVPSTTVPSATVPGASTPGG